MVFCLLALSSASLADNSDGAEYRYNIVGYVGEGNGNFTDPDAYAVITKVTGTDAEDYVIVSTKLSKKGITDGEFEFVDFKHNTVTDSGVTYFFNIVSKHYKIKTIPFVKPRPVIIGTEMVDITRTDDQGVKTTTELGYEFSRDNLHIAAEDSSGRKLITGEKDSASMITVALKKVSELKGIISEGDFRIIGAKVELIKEVDEVTEVFATTHTNKKGEYVLKSLPDEYILRVSADGYVTKEVTVNLGVTGQSVFIENINDMEKNKEVPLPRTLMILAGIVGGMILLASVIYLLLLRRSPRRSIIYDDEE